MPCQGWGRNGSGGSTRALLASEEALEEPAGGVDAAIDGAPGILPGRRRVSRPPLRHLGGSLVRVRRRLGLRRVLRELQPYLGGLARMDLDVAGDGVEA